MPDYRDFQRLRMEDTLVGLMLLNHNVVKKDSKGNTALHYAAKSDNLKMTALLLCADTDVNAQNNDGETPLFAAVKYGCAKSRSCFFLLEPKRIWRTKREKLLNSTAITAYS